MNTYLYAFIWVCIIGACLGSFYNVVILRSLSGESIVFPPSKCPKCGHKLYLWHNIPILSYILLRGKCHFCKEKISIQYPIVEFTTMFFFGLFFLKYGISLTNIFIFTWISCLIIMTVTDLKEKVVDCNVAIIMAVMGLVYGYLTARWFGVLHHALGMIAGALIMEVLARLGYLFTKSRAMGEADTYVAGAMGAIVGLTNIVPLLIMSVVISMVFVIPMFIYNKFKQKNWLAVCSFFAFVISIMLYLTVLLNYFGYALLIITGLVFGYSVLKGINKEQNRNYLPYVPALSAAMIIYLILV